VARGLRAEGARVAIVARHEERLRAAAAELGPEVLAVPADTTDDAAVRAMVEEVVGAWGGVDVLVNAAAQPAGGPVPALADLTDAEVQADFDTKVLGYLRCARAVAPHMTAQGRGRIVNISGLNARRTGSIAGGIRNVAVAALTRQPRRRARAVRRRGDGRAPRPRRDRTHAAARRRSRRRERAHGGTGARRPRRGLQPAAAGHRRGGRERRRLPLLAVGRRGHR
jgi:NAD(P)-dependent dehydrogenase (short-subunit alcohol dehydrogenase family)